jgi:hypothetical protein
MDQTQVINLRGLLVPLHKNTLIMTSVEFLIQNQLKRPNVDFSCRSIFLKNMKLRWEKNMWCILSRNNVISSYIVKQMPID